MVIQTLHCLCLSICSLGKDESQVVGEEIKNFSVIQFHRSYIDLVNEQEQMSGVRRASSGSVLFYNLRQKIEFVMKR